MRRELPETLTVDLGSDVTMEFVLVKPGSFTMGKGTQAHRVIITNPFYLGTREATQAQYEAVTGTNPSKWKGPNRPVESVSWDDASEFCKKLSQRTGKTVRLPTEAEWEYACRAGSTTHFCFGNDSRSQGDYAWHSGNSGGQTHPVGRKRPNAWGLYDMHGNVGEWCADRYDHEYPTGTVTDPMGPAKGSYRALRGGSWDFNGINNSSWMRRRAMPAERSTRLGFRVAMSAVDPER
jgi:formylglycine-generating enzyme required for sulfatase activity